MDTADIEARLRAAYLDTGGTEDGFRAARAQLLEAHRRQAAITAASEPVDGTATINADIRRLAFRNRRTVPVFSKEVES